jgi:hypothetical protein
MKKSLADISWRVPEEVYRQDPALSYSILARYEREGFEHLDTLFEKVESPSLLFGSCVDTLLTDGEQAFADNYFISDIPKVSPSAEPIVKEIYTTFHNAYTNINDIPDDVLMPILSQAGYKGNTNWGTKAKCDAIRKDGAQYYQTMFMAGEKTIVPQEMYNRIFACVRALKDSPATKMYFAENDPYSDIERYYQLKFKGSLGGVDYRCMMDLAVVNHKEKYIIPCDLKTSSHREYDFPLSFQQWHYQCQARLYWRLLRQAMDNDDYFKDFELLEYRFIVVNNIDNPVPLVWGFRQTKAVGVIDLGGKKFRDPETIGNELRHYLDDSPVVPDGISISKPNSIETWFNERQ